MTHPPVPTRSLCIAIAIADKLRQRLLAREWPPGAAINDGVIAAGYGISRTPVREALKLLCHEGLLELNGRRGMAVAIPTPAQLREAVALQQWLTHFVAEHRLALPSEADSLAQRMLHMASNRLQLAGVMQGQWPARERLAPCPLEASEPAAAVPSRRPMQ